MKPVFEAGKAAALASLPMSACPFRSGSAKRVWTQGWLEAANNAALPPFHCPLCAQHITDGKPCGCGARS